VVALDFHRIFVGILDIVLFNPKELFTFRTLPHKHWHYVISILADTMTTFSIFMYLTSENFKVQDLKLFAFKT